MRVAEITTNAVQPYDFLRFVFKSKASLLSPIVLFPESFGLSTEGSIGLSDACKMKELVANTGWSTLGPACLGQYSLVHKTSVFALAKLDVHLRQATEAEAEIDFENFGEQIMGEKVKDNPEDAGKITSFRCLGERYYYRGPSRIVLANFITRVEKGSFPDLETIKRVGEEIGALAAILRKDVEFADGVKEDGYFFVFADLGQIFATQIMELGDFPEFSKLQHIGHMKMLEGKLLFLPANHSGPSIDFSGNIIINE